MGKRDLPCPRYLDTPPHVTCMYLPPHVLDTLIQLTLSGCTKRLSASHYIPHCIPHCIPHIYIPDIHVPHIYTKRLSASHSATARRKNKGNRVHVKARGYPNAFIGPGTKKKTKKTVERMRGLGLTAGVGAGGWRTYHSSPQTDRHTQKHTLARTTTKKHAYTPLQAL